MNSLLKHGEFTVEQKNTNHCLSQEEKLGLKTLNVKHCFQESVTQIYTQVWDSGVGADTHL